VVLAAAAVFVSWPTLLNGHACEVTVESVFITTGREVDVKYRAVLAYGTELSWIIPGAVDENYSFDDTWASCPPGWLRRPRPTLPGRNLIPLDALNAGEKDDLPSLQKALVLQRGTYRIRPGEQLVYFRFIRRDGTPIEGRLKARYND
jgi:hypothetical protein